MENNNERQFSFDTMQIHAGQILDRETLSRAVPIYQTTAYGFNNSEHAKKLFSLEEGGNIYTRLGNPTQDVLEKRVAALEGGVGALAFSSGHAAIFSTIVNIAHAGDEIVSSTALYGGTINLFSKTLPELGINVKFADPDNIDEFENLTTEKTKAYYIESVGNPNCNLCDIEKIAELAHKHNVPLIVDSTFTTPYLMKPIELGADIVIHSATKFLGGHGTSMGGIVVDGGNFNWDNGKFPCLVEPDESYHGISYVKDCGKAAFITKLRAHILRDIGASISPFNAFMLLTGIETLSLRIQKHCENALKVAEFLSKNENVSFVNYPFLPDSKYNALAKRILPKGCGAVFTFGLKGGKKAGIKFIDNLKVFSHVANVGDVRSLVIHPASTTHSQLTSEELEKAGICEDTIRLSIGLEDIDDILWDLKQAIDIAVK